MKKSKIISFCIVFVFFAERLFAQGFGGTLTFQGLENFTMHSAAARGAGNISIAAQNDIALMFQNPATLQSLNVLQVSFGDLFRSTSTKQQQNYGPVRYYPNLSLLLEGQTAQIPNPDTSLFGFTAQDTVQRPFDKIGPNWSRSDNKNFPIQALIAAPVLSGDIKIVAGIGAVEYANLNHYYQNNNVLSPSILSHRPLPELRPTDDNPVKVDWSQQIRSRKGSIQGYGFALAGKVEKYNLSLGLSGMILNGSSDDYEQIIGRGNLTFFSNAFRADSVYSRVTKNGTSDFSGQEYTLSGILSGKNVSIGFSVKLPTTITRKYTTEIVTDTTGVPQYSTIKNQDKLKLPWHGIIGLSLIPKENLKLGIEYEFRPFASARYIDPNGRETSPWLSASLLRAGVEYMVEPWLTLRVGMRGQAEVFQTVGNKIEDEPVTYTVYSAGLGIYYSGLRINLAYENAVMKYQDVWATAVSKNREWRQTVIADLSYEIPWEY